MGPADAGVACDARLVAECAAIVVCVVALAVAMVLLARRRWRLSKPYVAALWLLPLGQGCALVTIVHIVASHGGAWYEVLAVVAVALFCAVGDVVLARGCDVAAEKRLNEQGARLLEQQVALQASHLEELEAEHARAVELRGAFSEKLGRVRAALGERDRDAALAALEDAAGVLRPTGVRYCQHRVVDALLAGKASGFEQGGVRFLCTLAIPDDLEIRDVMLCAIFSNVLDNAAHACAELPEGDRWVDLRARVVDGRLLVRCVNPCGARGAGEKGEKGEKGGRATGEKGEKGGRGAGGRALGKRSVEGRSVEGHGWGLEILELIARDRDGSLEAGRQGDRFVVEMALKA